MSQATNLGENIAGLFFTMLKSSLPLVDW